MKIKELKEKLEANTSEKLFGIDEEAKKAVANGAIESKNELNQHVATLVSKAYTCEMNDH